MSARGEWGPGGHGPRTSRPAPPGRAGRGPGRAVQVREGEGLREPRRLPPGLKLWHRIPGLWAAGGWKEALALDLGPRM